MAIAMDWDTASSYYINLASMIAADPTKVPFAYRLANLGSGAARADVTLQVIRDTDSVVVGETTYFNQYFPDSGTNSEAHLLPLIAPLVPGTSHTMIARAQNGYEVSAGSPGTLTAGPIMRKFVTAGTPPAPPGPGPIPSPTPNPEPTPSPSGAGAGLLIAGLAAVALLAGKGRRR